jgi:hypothetical protein
MTTTSDDDGTTPVDAGDAFPVTPAYGSRALGDHDTADTAPIVGLPLVPAPIDPVVTASLDSWPPEPVQPVAPPAYVAPPVRVEPEPVAPAVAVAPEAVAPQAPADEHPTVVLAAGAAGAAYVADDVLPAGPVGRGHRAAKEPHPPKEPKPAREHRSEPAAHGTREPRLRRTGPTPLGRVVLPLILALVSGVAIVAGWIHLQEDRAASATAPNPSASSSSGGPAAPVVGPSAPGSAPSSNPTTSPTTEPASPTPTVSDSPSPVASTPPAVVASSPAASPSGSASSTTVDRSVPVVVLNSTSRVGLAAKVAAQLRKDGWTVVLVGNFRGTLAVTTVYAEGNADAVATMQSDLPTKDRQKPPFGAMNPKRLTVVIGTDYPRS